MLLERREAVIIVSAAICDVTTKSIPCWLCERKDGRETSLRFNRLISQNYSLRIAAVRACRLFSLSLHRLT